jgi:hypothetical protein
VAVIRTRISRGWQNPAPVRDLGERVARQVTKLIDRKMTKYPAVEVARAGPNCDGLPGLDFLDGAGCGDTVSGPIVLANRRWGVPTLVSWNVPRPYIGTAGPLQVSASEYQEPEALTGRFFVDTDGNVYEGRNGGYHHGGGFSTSANGTFIETGGAFPSAATDYSYANDCPGGDVFSFQKEYFRIEGTPDVDVQIASIGEVPGVYSGFSYLVTDDVFYLTGEIYSVSDWFSGTTLVPTTWLRPHRGLSSTTSGTRGYRDSDTFCVGIERICDSPVSMRTRNAWPLTVKGRW